MEGKDEAQDGLLVFCLRNMAMAVAVLTTIGRRGKWMSSRLESLKKVVFTVVLSCSVNMGLGASKMAKWTDMKCAKL